MGALAHYFEREGIATTQISLVREHTEIMRPPRALWVPFMLGRPFGAPNAPEFQRKVLITALKLLEAEQGPVLEDFPEDAPASVHGDQMEGFACPVNLSRPGGPPGGENDITQALLDEIAQLQPWHDFALKRRGRSTMGLSGLAIDEAARFVASHVGTTPLPSYSAVMSVGEALKRACDDLKAFYFEAASAQPGNLDNNAVDQWFWRETTAGKLFLELREVCLKSAEKSMQMLGGSTLVPRAIAHTIGAGAR